MSPDTLDNVFFFVTNKQRHLEQAIFSAKRIQKLMPHCPIVMFVVDPLNWETVPKDIFRMRIEIYPHEEYSGHEKEWFLMQNHCMRLAVGLLDEMGATKAVYLDCDTYMIDPVPELFEMLDHFDFMGTHAPGRQTADTVYPIPECFPEINIGVNPMVIHGHMEAFWSEVAAKHLEHLDVFGNNDQAPLRQTLFECYHRFPKLYVMPPEYNLRFHFPFFVSKRAKILHGPQEYAERAAEVINSVQGMRSWDKIIPTL